MTKETLEKLAAECSESTSEIFTPNDFYGHAHILKTYCEINQEISLPGIYPHGISIRNDSWEAELKHPMPFLLLKSKLQSVVYSQYCDKPSWIIGAPNYYAVRLIEDELKEIQSNAKGTLILPIHSTHHLTNNYDFNEFVKYLKGLPEIHKPLTICLGWRDIQLKKHERYLEQGFECTTAGHMYDKEFFCRLVRIIASHQFAIINDIGTAAFYAAAMDLPVILFRQKIETNPAKSDQPAYLLQEANFRPCLPIVERFIETCINPDEQMVQRQKSIAQLVLGHEDIKKPDELRDLFESLWLKNEMKLFIKKPNYIAEGSLSDIIESIGKRINSYPRKTPGRVKIDGLPFAFADLHSFYHQVIQIFGTDLYGFESETDEPVIVDCGAHMGLASLYFAKIFPKGTIYAFEADPNIARMLKKNVQTLGLKQVKIIAKAVWIHNEGVQFNITGDDSGYVCLNQNTSSRRIPSFRLRDFLQINKVDLLKIDIEGSEYDVIKDCDEYLSKAKHMIIEVHKFYQNGVLLGDILRILEKNGFNYSVGDLHVADWIKQSVKTPFTRLKTDSFIITIFAWQQNAREQIQPIQIHQSKLAPAIRMADITPGDQCKQDSDRKNRSAPGTQILQVADHQMKGGAAMAGYRLFTGLKNDGVNVKLISFSASARNELACHDWVNLLKSMPGSFNQKAVNRPAFPNQVWLEIVSSVLNSEHPEIINIHNIHEAIHYYGVPLDIIEVMACKARLVFTLHDMWLLTGRCAYAGACNRFAELSCNEECPTVSEYPCLEPLQIFDALKRKRELLLKHPETVIVTPSQWLAGEVRKSYLGNHRIEVIPYGIDLDIFYPDTSRRLFREKCGIRSDEFVLLTAAADLNDKRKGMHLLWDALSMIKSEVVLMLVGNGRSIPSLPENVRLIHQGFVADQSDMARFYSAADLFICPTLADNLPCVLIESISCGTPCIGFRSGGVSDVIRPNITGWLVEETSAESLAKVINSIISNPNSAAELKVSCRRVAESEYAINMQAERYEALFRELIQNSDKMNHAQKLSGTPSNRALIETCPEEHYKSILPPTISSRQKEACSKLEKFLESYPDFALAHNDIGVLYYKQGMKEKALSHYRQAVQFEPQNITFQKNLADFYYIELGQFEKAMQIYVKVLNANPEDIEALLALAHICVALEKFDDAKDFYNRILKIEPGSKDAGKFLAKLEKCQLSVAGGRTDQENNDVDSNGYLVSAIVSTYNAERFIRGCLVDLEAQSIADKLEIIVVDTGSEQNESAVVEEFQKSYSNIRYLRVENRETVYQAWNRGLRAAHGKYITSANTDDRHRRDALEKLVDILEKRPDMVLAYGDCFITRVENEQFEKFTPAGRYNWPDFSRNSLLNSCIIGPQPVWRRSLHKEFGYFDENYRCGADYEFWLRISERHNFIHIREYLGLFFANENTISMKGDLPKKEMEEIKETYRKRYERVPILKSGEESIYRILHELNMNKTEVNILVNSEISDTLFEDISKLPSVIVYKKGQVSSTHTWDAILISADEVEGVDFAELMLNFDFRYIGISEKAYHLSENKCTGFLNGLSELGCHNLFGDYSVFEWSERATFGRILFEQGKLREAARFLHKILDADPTDVNGLNTMGLISLEQKSFDKAEEFTLKALQLDRRNVNTLVNLSEICFAKGQYQRAREFAEQAIEIDGGQQNVLERKLGIKLDKSTVAGEYRKSRHLSPKRILVINNLYPPQELGGYGRLMCDFANILEKRGHTIQVLTSDTPYLGQIEKDESNIDRGLLLYGGWQDGICKQIDDNDRVIQTIKTNLEKVRSIIRGFRPDLCLLGNIDFLSHIVLTPLLEMRIPVIHHLGNKMPGYNVNDTPQSNLYRLATASRWLRDEILRQGYPLKDISIVYPGALVEEFRMPVLPALDKLRIAYAGIVLPYKGPHILIEALKMLHKKGVDFYCALAGTTTDVGFVDRLKRYVAASGMQDKIDFLGFLPRAKLKTFFARNNVLVFPSIVQEAFGISQVEAMAAGLTVISSGTGGAKEIIEHGQSGLIFEPNNSKSLAKELLDLVKNPEKWQSIAKGGEKRAIEKFDIERSVDILEHEVLKLINRRHPADCEYQSAKIGDEMMEKYGTFESQEYGFYVKTAEALYEEVHKLINNENKKEAIGALKMFLAIYPSYALAHKNLGLLYYNEGEKKKALGHYEQAARLEPENPELQKILADFYYVEQGPCGRGNETLCQGSGHQPNGH